MVVGKINGVLPGESLLELKYYISILECYHYSLNRAYIHFFRFFTIALNLATLQR